MSIKEILNITNQDYNTYAEKIKKYILGSDFEIILISLLYQINIHVYIPRNNNFLLINSHGKYQKIFIYY